MKINYVDMIYLGLSILLARVRDLNWFLCVLGTPLQEMSLRESTILTCLCLLVMKQQDVMKLL